jgi:hypothetical protein
MWIVVVWDIACLIIIWSDLLFYEVRIKKVAVSFGCWLRYGKCTKIEVRVDHLNRTVD